jgi:hypothetical protein
MAINQIASFCMSVAAIVGGLGKEGNVLSILTLTSQIEKTKPLFDKQ